MSRIKGSKHSVSLKVRCEAKSEDDVLCNALAFQDTQSQVVLTDTVAVSQTMPVGLFRLFNRQWLHQPNGDEDLSRGGTVLFRV